VRVNVAVSRCVTRAQSEYNPDPIRQGIADSWPFSLDDTKAREEWDWSHEYDMDALVRFMVTRLREIKGK
jgi:nucleoside-diphosphate-sugar epimerase